MSSRTGSVLFKLDLFVFYPIILSVPSGPPRKVEVEAVNSTSVKVLWRSPVPSRQHGQIRGYQVHYVRMVNGEPVGHPVIKDILIDDAQVGTHLHSCSISHVSLYKLLPTILILVYVTIKRNANRNFFALPQTSELPT